MLFHIYTDGAARGNPGPSASGYQIYDHEHKLVARASLFNGIATNNVAEYKAVIEALKRLGKMKGFDNEVSLTSDSELVINQLQGNYKVKDPKMKALHAEATTLMRSFKAFSMRSVKRTNRYISSVDKELNILLDKVKYSKDEDKKEHGFQLKL